MKSRKLFLLVFLVAVGAMGFCSVAYGADWTQAPAGANWSARSTFTALTFSDKMWLMAGLCGGCSQLNDVWSSTDGITWTQATSSANWAGRQYPQSLVFNGKMWIIGGNAGTERNDVWSSTDGITWTQATSSANWIGRHNFGALVFDNKMWVMGGESNGPMLRDVWSSTDGITWTQATSSANWSARGDFSALVFNNKMWVMGGWDVGFKNDVWSSTDGITWTQATSSANWSARSVPGALVFDNKMWVMGGYSGDVKNDVWLSTDGITWTQAISSVVWSARQSFGSPLVFNNKMWVMGGEDSSGIKNNNVYYLDIAPSVTPSDPVGVVTGPSVSAVDTGRAQSTFTWGGSASYFNIYKYRTSIGTSDRVLAASNLTSTSTPPTVSVKCPADYTFEVVAVNTSYYISGVDSTCTDYSISGAKCAVSSVTRKIDYCTKPFLNQ